MSFFSRKPLKTLNEIRIFQDHILQNLTLYGSHLLDGVDIFPTIKSDGYGHGLVQMATLLQKFETPYFAMDSYFEAITVRKHFPDQKILLLGENALENFAHMDFRNITFAIANKESLKVIADLGRKISIHLKFNTGMNRQGFQKKDLPFLLSLLKKSPHIKSEGIFSHFADADNPDNTFTNQQERIFGEILDFFAQEGVSFLFTHLGNSAGALKVEDKRINACRLGIGMYGYNPLVPEDTHFSLLKDLQPALEAWSTITNVQDLKKGDRVSYNGIFTAPEDMKIGIIPFGYFEGFDRKLSSRDFHPKEKGFQILGRVCMNLTACTLPMGEKVGDSLCLISRHEADFHSVQNMAKRVKTISYEILTRLHSSIRRKII